MVNRLKRLTFWGADDNDDSLPRDVIAGRKTVTADTVDDYYKPYGEYGDGSYAAGDLIEVYDLKQRLRCLIRATKVERTARRLRIRHPAFRTGRGDSALKPACGLDFKLVLKSSMQESCCKQEFDKRSPSRYTTANSSIAAKEKT